MGEPPLHLLLIFVIFPPKCVLVRAPELRMGQSGSEGVYKSKVSELSITGHSEGLAGFALPGPKVLPGF